MPGRVRIFLNPRSGSNKAETTGMATSSREESLKGLFTAQGCLCEVTHVGPGIDLCALAAEDPVEMPYVAAGGDGTVNAVAAAVAGSSRSMGVLPAGTLNHFARDLGLPPEMEGAVAVISSCLGEGHTRLVDAAEVNGQIFVNNSSLGAYPAMVMDRERMKKSGRNKWASLVAASVRAFVRFRHLHVEVMVNGTCRTCTTPFLFVGNNAYTMEGAQMGSREHLDRGVLALQLAPGASRLGILRMAAAALVGRLRDLPDYEELLVEEFTVHVYGRRRLRVSLDGEVRRIAGPVRYRTLPGALRVLCPQPKETGGAA